MNDISYNIEEKVVYVTSNDGKLYRIDLTKTHSADEENDDFLDEQGDDGDQVIGDPHEEIEEKD